MVVPERDVDAGTSGTLHGAVDLRVPLLDGRGTLTTTVDIDGRGAFGAGSGGLDATATLRTPAVLRLALPDDRGMIVGELHPDGQVRLTLAVPGGVEQLDGSIGIKGTLGLLLPLPGTVVPLELPATLDATADLRTTAPACFCLDTQGTVALPLALHLPVPGNGGALDVNVMLDSHATLRMALPGGHGQIQAQGLGVGSVALMLPLLAGHGHITARGSIRTPVTLSMIVPDGRAKLRVYDDITSEVELRMALPGGGEIDARGMLPGRIQAVLFLPSGRGELQATTPVHTIIHLKDIPIPHSHGVLSADLDVDGTAELAIEMPDRSTHVRLRFEAALPLAPLVKLVHAELESQVHVERIEVRPPDLIGPDEVMLPLSVEVRKGVLVRVDVTAHLRIDAHSKELELWSVHAHGRNTAGRAASRFYLNRKVFKPLRHILLFNPSTMLPSTARIDSLAFKAASPDALAIAGDLTFNIA